MRDEDRELMEMLKEMLENGLPGESRSTVRGIFLGAGAEATEQAWEEMVVEDGPVVPLYDAIMDVTAGMAQKLVDMILIAKGFGLDEIKEFHAGTIMVAATIFELFKRLEIDQPTVRSDLFTLVLVQIMTEKGMLERLAHEMCDEHNSKLGDG